MNYAETVELLGFKFIDAKDINDEDPPWDFGEVTWRGKEVPYVRKIKIEFSSGHRPKIRIWVAGRKERGYKKDDPEFRILMLEIKERGVEIIGWPEPADLGEGEKTEKHITD